MEGSPGSLLSPQAWTSVDHRAMPQPSSDELKATQPSAVVLPTGLETVGALLRAERGLTGVAPDQAELSVTDRATLGFAVPQVFCVVTHFQPPKAFGSSFSFASRSC